MQQWEYLFVETALDKGTWRPYTVNGKELPNWKNGPRYQDYANQLGEQGWELVAAPVYVRDVNIWKDLVFRRSKA